LNTFPNPGKNSVSISGNFLPSEDFTVNVLSALGSVVYSASDVKASAGSTIFLDQMNLAPGMYFITVQNQRGRWFGKWTNQ
jgi:hypothetical protein